jgi:hypothetical protein
MLKKSIVAVLFLLVFSFSMHAQEACNKVVHVGFGISLCAPTDWTAEKDAQGDVVISGEKINGLTPNIILTGEDSPVSLAKYSKEQVAYMVANYKTIGASSMELKSQTEFQAGSLHGYKAVIKCLYKNEEIWIIQYRFSGKGNTKILINVSLPSAVKTKFEKIIDDSVATFRLSK